MDGNKTCPRYLRTGGAVALGVAVVFAVAISLFVMGNARPSDLQHDDLFPHLAPNPGQRNFPELKGMTQGSAVAYIKKINPNLRPVIMRPTDIWTRDAQSNRVRIAVDPASGLVTNEPGIG